MIDSTTAADSTQQTDDGADGGDDSSGSADKPPAAPLAPSPRVRATATAAPPLHQPSPHKTTNGVLKRMFGSNADSNTQPAAAPPSTAAAAMLLATAQHPPSIATVNGIHGMLGVGGGPASTTTPGLASRSRSSSSSSPSSPSPYISDASRPPSRAPSASGGAGGIGRVATPASVAVEPPSGRRSRASSAAGDDGLVPGTGYTGPYLSPNEPPKRPPSIASVASSATGESHKFKLSDLLSSGPKLARKASASSRKSASAKSDSERGGGGGGGSAIESTGSLKKYGVCERIAIGKGATSVVKLAHKWDRTEEKLYAVKEFRKRRKNETEKEYVKKLTSEFCISSTLHHVNVVETVDLVQDESQHWCEVMEYCPGGDLYAAIKKGGMSGSEIECCFKQILNGLGYLHSQGVAHRDIKPENLFFDARGHLKIGDFGASTVYRLPWEATVHMSSGLCGSEPYIAPEQFSSKLYDARLVDIWACGVVYYCLQFQELPWRVAQPSDTLFSTYRQQCASPAFSIAPSHQPPQQQGESARAAAEREKNTTYPTTIMNLPRPSRATLRRMLEPDPRHRCTIETVLKMPWVHGIETCTDPNVVPKHIHACARGAAGSSA